MDQENKWIEKLIFKKLIRVCFCLSLFVISSCTNNSSPDGSTTSAYPYNTASNYFKKSKNIIVEVYYEPGAEPFSGTTASGREIWGVLEDNLNSIFQYRSVRPTITVPKVIGSMTSIPAQSKSNWLGTEIVALNSSYKQGQSTEDTSYFYVYFLKGYFNNGSGSQTSVIGVSLGGTPVIAIFKDVVKASASNPSGPVAKFVEQSTLVHEMGHALGFVNNGVPMVGANHQDTAHGAHSTNSNCVMYYLNEGSTDLVQFIQNYLSSSSFSMWGPEVLADAQSFSQ